MFFPQEKLCRRVEYKFLQMYELMKITFNMIKVEVNSILLYLPLNNTHFALLQVTVNMTAVFVLTIRSGQATVNELSVIKLQCAIHVDAFSLQ